MTHRQRVVRETADEILNLRTGWVEEDVKKVRKLLYNLYDQAYNRGERRGLNIASYWRR